MNNNCELGNLILDFNSLKFKRFPIEDLGFFKRKLSRQNPTFGM